MEYKDQFEKLKPGVSFEFERQRYDVNDARYNQGKYYLYTDQQRTFVKDGHQFKRFYDSIKIITRAATQIEPDKPQIPTQTHNTMDTETKTAVVAVNNTTANMANGLMEMFNKVVANPTPENIEAAKAASAIGNTMVALGQMQVNLLKLKNNV